MKNVKTLGMMVSGIALLHGCGTAQGPNEISGPAAEEALDKGESYAAAPPDGDGGVRMPVAAELAPASDEVDEVAEATGPSLGEDFDLDAEGGDGASHTAHVDTDPTTAADSSQAAAAGHQGSEAHAGHAGTGPYIDDSAIPPARPGVPDMRIARYGDRYESASGDGDFRTVCEFSHMAYDDPIVHPGQPGAAHLHTFWGNTGTDAHSTADSIANSGNSTCKGGIANRTGYWTPSLIAGDGSPIAPKSINVYYKHGYQHSYHDDPSQSVEPWPEGLRMIAGGSPTDTTLDDHAKLSCEQGSRPQREVSDLESCYPDEILTLHVEFPACWDGQNLDSSDHRSHMAYGQNGDCPASHPVPIPVITTNVVYEVPQDRFGGASLASDAYDRSAHPSGQSLHADWFDGWDARVVDVLVDNCTNDRVNCGSHLLGDGNGLWYGPEQLPRHCRNDPSLCPSTGF